MKKSKRKENNPLLKALALPFYIGSFISLFYGIHALIGVFFFLFRDHSKTTTFFFFQNNLSRLYEINLTNTKFILLICSILLLVASIFIAIGTLSFYFGEFLWRSKKWKKRYLSVFFIIAGIIVIPLLVQIIAGEIHTYYQRNKDLLVTRRAFDEGNPKLCEQTYDTSYCYYQYARATKDISLCRKEIMTNEWIIPCKSMIGRGYNYTVN